MRGTVHGTVLGAVDVQLLGQFEGFALGTVDEGTIESVLQGTIVGATIDGVDSKSYGVCLVKLMVLQL